MESPICCMPDLCVTLIAAVSEDGFISRGQGVPWDLPADRAYFRKYTTGQWLLLGKSTYLEMLGWFRDHQPLVLSRDPTFQPPVGMRVASVAEAMQRARAAEARELVVCGGSQAYAQSLPYARRLLLTRVQDTLGHGVAFPELDASEWQVLSEEHHVADQHHAFAFTFLTLQRHPQPSFGP